VFGLGEVEIAEDGKLLRWYEHTRETNTHRHIDTHTHRHAHTHTHIHSHAHSFSPSLLLSYLSLPKYNSLAFIRSGHSPATANLVALPSCPLSARAADRKTDGYAHRHQLLYSHHYYHHHYYHHYHHYDYHHTINITFIVVTIILTVVINIIITRKITTIFGTCTLTILFLYRGEVEGPGPKAYCEGESLSPQPNFPSHNTVANGHSRTVTKYFVLRL
jgi:hypothetical protein